jgi:hypothetical protein
VAGGAGVAEHFAGGDCGCFASVGGQRKGECTEEQYWEIFAEREHDQKISNYLYIGLKKELDPFKFNSKNCTSSCGCI